MLNPTHAKKNFTANRVFTGRGDERGLFSAAIGEADTQESYKVLMWYGVGGQGKSALLREFGRTTKIFNEVEAEKKSGKKLISAKIDFDDERLKRIDAALYSIRLQFAQTSGFSFHTFDTAFIAYYKKTRPGIDIASAFPELFKGEKEGMMDLIDVLDGPLSLATDLASAALPGANLLYKWGARLTGKLASWWKSRGNEELSSIEQLQPEQLLERLPRYLGIDICDGIKAKPKLRPVILLDTYEALWRDRGQKDGLADRRADAWVRLLVQDAPGILFVIAGRDKLRWGEIDEAWNSVIDAHLLGDLSDEDAERFLLDVPITEADVREKIVSSSNGLPFYLDLQVSQYEALREQDKTPVADQFGGTPSDILARFLEHLSEADQGALRLASYLQVITRPVMDELAEAFPGRAINYSFDQMVSRSSFVEISEETYEIHALMKDELQRREKDEHEGQFRKVHRHLHEYFLAEMEKFQDPQAVGDAVFSFQAAFHHLFAADPVAATSWLLVNRMYLEIRNAWGTFDEVSKKALEFCEKSHGENLGDVFSLRNNLAKSMHEQGNHEVAEVAFLELLEEILKQDHPENMEVTPTVYFNLGQVYFSGNELEKSHTYFNRSIKIFEKNTEKFSVALSLSKSTLAEIQYRGKKLTEAQLLLWSAVSYSTKVKNPTNLATSLVQLSEALHASGSHEIAISLFLKALDTDPFFQPELLECTSHDIEPKTNTEGQDGEEREQNSILLDSNLLGSLWERRLFNVFPYLFEENTREQISQFRNSNQRKAMFEDEDFENVFLNGQPSAEYIAVETHPFAADLRTDAREMLSMTAIGSLLWKVVEYHKIEIAFYAGRYFDFGYRHSSRLLWVSLPPEIKTLDVQHIAGLIYAIRTADHCLINFDEPPGQKIEAKWAAIWHAKCLDRILYIMKYINELEDVDRVKYLAVLSVKAVEICDGYRSNKPHKELYDIYAQLAWEPSQ